MGRTSDKKKRRHSSHKGKLREDPDSSDDETSSSDSDSESCSLSSSECSSDTSSSEEEKRRRKRKKARRMSKEKRRDSKLKKKPKKGKSKKKRLGEKSSTSTISMDDYYLRSAEFRTWLSNERKTFFSDLTSEESRALFKKFVKKWNGGNLEQSYYHGIQSSAVGHDSQSNYQWKFSSGVKPSELQGVRDSVSSWSSSKTSLGSSSAPPQAAASASSSIGPLPPVKGPSRLPPSTTIGPTMPPPRIIGPSMGPVRGEAGHDVFETEIARDREQARLKKERREFRKQQELMMDEMVPKATGREARLEKKKIRAEKRKDRELSPGLDEVSTYGVSGSGSSSISSKVKARQVYRQNRAVAAAQRISDYQAKEKATAEAILEMAKAHKKEGALW